MNNLLIVESPTKAKTIEKFLGQEFKVIASKGHVVDLPKSKLGIEIDNHFKPEYVTSLGKSSIISQIKKEIPKDGTVYIASDPDREGEAIGWHVANVIGLIDENGNETKIRGKNVVLKRIVFHEITKEAIVSAIRDSRKLDKNLFLAQQARRVLDRLVGYKLSPLLWTKIRYGLSAGRVQSVAVKFIVDRERERNAFKSEEYWTIDGSFETFNKDKLTASLFKLNGENPVIKNTEDSSNIKNIISDTKFIIKNIEKKEYKKNPYPPFITSSLQQEANKKFGFNAKKTMSIAQKLYEGIKSPEGSLALITYMRTDSYSISPKAIESIRIYITKELGKEYLPVSEVVYKKKSKLSQEAHEAIRPVDINKSPEKVSKILSDDEYKIYTLIWKRTVGSQIRPAIYESQSIDIYGENIYSKYNFLFRSHLQRIIFKGFLKIYNYEKEKDEVEFIKDIKENEDAKLIELNDLQHFTQPPARYSEASLIKILEENGIGRPSTYAPIISTILDRGYVQKEGKYIFPTDVGYVVNDLLAKHFSDIVDVSFTSEIEEELDEIANGKRSYELVIKNFYIPFEKNLNSKDKEIKKEDVVNLGESDEKCPLCDEKMIIKLGKFGRFLSCSKFPECKGMKSIIDSDQDLSNEICDKCKSPLVIKKNSKGIDFLACSKYPECDFTKAIPTGLVCDLCGSDLVKRKSKWNKFFYGCSKYPECKFILNIKKEKDEGENQSYNSASK